MGHFYENEREMGIEQSWRSFRKFRTNCELPLLYSYTFLHRLNLQVSHSRTPLHGINSQLELIREFSSATELRKIAPLLDIADVCLESLSDVLNDTLDFSKLSHNTAHKSAARQRRNLTQIDLSALIEGVLKTTWDRKRRLDSATADLGSARQVERQGKVDLILEVEGKEDGWEVMTDIGGMKRVLLNIVGVSSNSNILTRS